MVVVDVDIAVVVDVEGELAVLSLTVDPINVIPVLMDTGFLVVVGDFTVCPISDIDDLIRVVFLADAVGVRLMSVTKVLVFLAGVFLVEVFFPVVLLAEVVFAVDRFVVVFLPTIFSFTLVV